MPMQEVKAPTVPYIPADRPGIHSPLRGDDYFSQQQQAHHKSEEIRIGTRRIAPQAAFFVSQEVHAVPVHAHEVRPQQAAAVHIQRADRLPGARTEHTGRNDHLPNNTVVTSAPDVSPQAIPAGMVAIPLVTSAVGAGIGAFTHPGERWKYAKRGAAIGFAEGVVCAGAGCSVSQAEIAPVLNQMEFSSVSEDAARDAVLQFEGTSYSPGYEMVDADGDGAIEWSPQLNELKAVDMDTNQEAGVMSSALVESKSDVGYTFFLIENSGDGARALTLTNAQNSVTGGNPTVTSTLVDADGIEQATLIARTTYEADKPWATILYKSPAGEIQPKFYIYASNTYIERFQDAVTGGKPLLNIIPVALTATVESPATPVPTENPFAGAPEGTTGKDQETGRWTKEKDGKTLYYMPELASFAEDMRWVERRTPQSIYLLNGKNLTSAPSGFDKQMPLNVYFSEHLNQLSNIDQIVLSPNYTATYADLELLTWSFPNNVKVAFVFEQNNIDAQWNQRHLMTIEQIYDFFDRFSTMSVKIDIPSKAKDNSTATTYEWMPKNGYNVIVVDWDQADPAKDPSFFGSYHSDIRSKFVVIDKTLTAIVALNPNLPADVRNMHRLILEPLALAIQTQQLPTIDVIGSEPGRMQDERKLTPEEEDGEYWNNVYFNINDFFIGDAVYFNNKEKADGVTDPFLTFTNK